MMLRHVGVALLALGVMACTARGGGGGFFPVDAEELEGGVEQDAAPLVDAPAAGDVGSPVDAAGSDASSTQCTPNEVSCAGASTLRVCAADGMSTTMVPCGAGTRCADGQCVANVCAPEAYSCGPSGRRQCNAEGTEYADRPCVSVPNATTRCEGAGLCAVACRAGYGDCNANASDGCETSLSGDGANCGACGRRCEAGSMCREGSCVSSCGALTQCGSSCVDTRSSVSHCGRCDNACPDRPNAPAACAGGTCALQCAGTYADCDFNQATGCETDLETSAQNCGLCGRACSAGQSCVAGVCRTSAAPRSCRELLQMRPGTPSGPQRIDPDGSGSVAPFDVYCDMTTAGGGWTLVAVITNADTSRWAPSSAYWTNTTVLGSATSITSNADAKTPAWTSVAADELLILAGSTIEAQTATNCLRNQTMQQLMSASSVYSSSCHRSCAAVTQGGIFPSTGTCHGPGIRFRCRDDNTTTSAGGYLISTDDNSMITSMTNTTSCTAYQSGLGGQSTSTVADVDSSLTSSVSSSSTVPRILFVR